MRVLITRLLSCLFPVPLTDHERRLRVVQSTKRDH